MIFYFSIAFSLLFSAFGSIILQYNTESFREQSYDYCRQIVKSHILITDHYFSQLKDISRIFANDADILEAVGARTKDGEPDYGKELSLQRNVLNKIKQVDVLGNVDTTLLIGSDLKCLYAYGHSPKRDFDFSREEWFSQAVTEGGYTSHFTGLHNTPYLISDSGSQTVSIITPIINTAQYMATQAAYLMLDVRLAPILTGEGMGKGVQFAIYGGDEAIYFPEGLLSSSQWAEFNAQRSAGSDSFALMRKGFTGDSYLVVRAQSQVSGWSILGFLPITEIETLRNASTLFAALMIAASVALIAALSLLISKSLLGPLNQLVGRFNDIAAGDTSVTFAPTRSKEIDLLADTARNMLESINRLSRESMENQALLSREQFKVLQHQINPHFFNNTLQSIKALAMLGDSAAISRITTLLGKILSYSVYSPLDMVPLERELDYIESYILLQMIRYPQISYTIDCPEEIKAVSVPKLIIQPIVENAIEHGFSNVKSGHIHLCAQAEGEQVHIIIVDSGVGFDQNKLEQIQQLLSGGDDTACESHIGIMNVHRRLVSIYGPGYGITILSRPGMQTSVVLTVKR
jgi:two-component system sensor histidine kinase YesM